MPVRAHCAPFVPINVCALLRTSAAYSSYVPRQIPTRARMIQRMESAVMATKTEERFEPRIEPYTHPAAGWGALKYVAINLLKENPADGFDCPGCAWPDREHASTFEFCENGVKAVAAEATSKRTTADFLAAHTVTELLAQSDY